MRFVETAVARIVLATPALSQSYARLLDVAAPRLRHTAILNLQRAGFNNSSEIADGVFRSIGRLIEAFARFPRMSPKTIHNLIRYEGLENFTNTVARRRGVLTPA